MCNFQEYQKMGDDLHYSAKISHKGINGHDPSSSLLCIYDRGGQLVAFFKGHVAEADQKSASFLSFSRPKERRSVVGSSSGAF